mmetsp:Transcript_44734/g.117303  ORF Transcript_44734/g.117303 Transcript_44734/m.117303 type:complete len:105 (+) Transcript_44734:82-396(+)
MNIVIHIAQRSSLSCQLTAVNVSVLVVVQPTRWGPAAMAIGQTQAPRDATEIGTYYRLMFMQHCTAAPAQASDLYSRTLSSMMAERTAHGPDTIWLAVVPLTAP